VLGNLELIGGGAGPAAVKDLAGAAEIAARQAADLTRQMLGFARRQPMQAAVVDLNALTREELTLLRRSIDPRIAIVFNPEPDLHPVVADATQVQQVLMNLCLNARDAMPDGGTLTLQTANVAAAPGPASADGQPATGYARLSVTDTGSGMSDEVRAK